MKGNGYNLLSKRSISLLDVYNRNICVMCLQCETSKEWACWSGAAAAAAVGGMHVVSECVIVLASALGLGSRQVAR